MGRWERRVKILRCKKGEAQVSAGCTDVETFIHSSLCPLWKQNPTNQKAEDTKKKQEFLRQWKIQGNPTKKKSPT